MAADPRWLAQRGRPKAATPLRRRDGFSWVDDGEAARLYDYLYSVVPPGQRRQMMMRYMLIGFMAERSVRSAKAGFVPPPVDLPANEPVSAGEAGQSAPNVASERADAVKARAEAADAPASSVAPAAVPEKGLPVSRTGVVKPGLFAGFKG